MNTPGKPVHDVLDEFPEIFVLRHEIGLAIHFHENAYLSLQMNVGSDDPFLGRARRFLARAGDAFGAQDGLGLCPDRRPLRPARVCNPSCRRWFFREVA